MVGCSLTLKNLIGRPNIHTGKNRADHSPQPPNHKAQYPLMRKQSIAGEFQNIACPLNNS